MNTEETKQHIEAIIKNSFSILKEVFKCQQEKDKGKKLMEKTGSRIIYPEYRDGTTRFSEQELRFVFVEQLNREIANGWDVYYSVETPTRERYNFQDKDGPKAVTEKEKGGQSAQFDLVIHDNKFNRIALIEFKANNPSEAQHKKDYCKLNKEGSTDKEECSTDDVLTYFIEVVKNRNKRTEKSINKKKEGFKGKFDWTAINELRCK